MNRKQFLTGCLTGTVAAGCSAWGYSWLAKPEEHVPRNTVGLQPVKDFNQVETEILYLASLAPSGHNAQPWVITVNSHNHWMIGSDRSRWLPVVDPENRELVLSIGAFCENLAAAANSYGYAAEFNPVGSNGFSTQLVEVCLSKSRENIGSDQALRGRRTIRKQILANPIRDEDLRYLMGSQSDGMTFHPAQSREGIYLRQATLAANEAQLASDAAQAELAEWIRWKAEEAKEHGTGLTPESMEMSGVIRWLAKNFLTKKDVMENTFRKETLKLVREQVENCAGWLLVRSAGQGLASLLQAGRVLEAAWLRAFEKSIAFHPMTQILEEPALKSALAREFEDKNIQFIIRVGYVRQYPQPVSIRLPLDRMIKSSQP